MVGTAVLTPARIKADPLRVTGTCTHALMHMQQCESTGAVKADTKVSTVLHKALH